MLSIFLIAARGYKSKNHAPRGIQSIVEPVIIFIRDDVVKPNIGKNFEKTGNVGINSRYISRKTTTIVSELFLF